MSVQVQSVAVIGGGLMGRGISAVLAGAGLAVTVVERDPATAEILRKQPIQGRHLGALEESVPKVDLVIEAITEDPQTKSELWHWIGEIAGTDTILTSNTSSLRIDELATVVPHPERVAGMHWFTPAELIPCIEVVRGAATSDDTVDTISALAVRAGKIPVPVADSPGFIANRLQFALLAEALRCVEDGIATPAQIDEIVRTSFGPRLAVLGPFANADLGGLDVYAAILRQLHEGLGVRYPASGMLHDLVATGRLGVKSGGGFEDYTAESAAELRAFRDALLPAVISLTESHSTGLDSGPWASHSVGVDAEMKKQETS